MICPGCGAPITAGDQFCESCGATLDAASAAVAAPEPTSTDSAPTAPIGLVVPEREAPPAAVCSCGGVIDADGWCTVCGLRATNERDHTTEQLDVNVAAVCDKGRVHARNEDAYALARTGDRITLVVCDGVTSTTDSDVASLAAARSARDELQRTADAPSRRPAALGEYWTDALERAVVAAQREAEAAAASVASSENPPSCTFVAAVVDGPVLVAGWVGDSRCYWFGADGTDLQVSVDDSWASAEVANGIPRDVAERDPRAHAITRWLGVDAPTPVPTCASIPVTSGGWVLVCSDGLWNYCSEAKDLSQLLTDQIDQSDGDALAVAAGLCDWANQQGGHDNVTVALAHLPSTDPTRSS
jgi:serine/threonine protein phosphatase PrpC